MYMHKHCECAYCETLSHNTQIHFLNTSWKAIRHKEGVINWHMRPQTNIGSCEQRLRISAGQINTSLKHNWANVQCRTNSECVTSAEALSQSQQSWVYWRCKPVYAQVLELPHSSPVCVCDDVTYDVNAHLHVQVWHVKTTSQPFLTQ